MTKCWQHDPAKRPRFADLTSILLDVFKILYFKLVLTNDNFICVLNFQISANQSKCKLWLTLKRKKEKCSSIQLEKL